MFQRCCISCSKVDNLKSKQNTGTLCRSCCAKERIRAHGNPMQGKTHVELTKFRQEYINIKYDDFILITTKAGKNKRRYRMTCRECGIDRGYLTHSEAKRTCLSCHTKRYTIKTKEQKHTYSCFKSNINARFKNRNLHKQAGIFRFLPYTIHDLMKHLENQFEPWMNWDNHGRFDRDRDTWHIDHIVADSKFFYNSPQDKEFLDSWALSNLRPLKAITNILKSDK